FSRPRSIDPQLPGTVARAPATTHGTLGLLVAIAGLFFAFAGAAIETALSAAYNLAQVCGWPWGENQHPRTAARFAVAWLAVFVVGTLIVLTGADPVQIVEYSIVFSVIVLPFTYFPVLMVARDKRIMGEHANGRFSSALGWVYLVVIAVAATGAP